jgi:hypothetical protein
MSYLVLLMQKDPIIQSQTLFLDSDEYHSYQISLWLCLQGCRNERRQQLA